MAIVKEGDSEAKSSELEKGLFSNSKSEELGVDTMVLKLLQTPNPSSSSSSFPFHALSESCNLKTKQLKSIRKKFQFLNGTVTCLPRPNEKACAFAHSEVCF